MTNLLPHERRRVLVRDYILRLGVVLFLFTIALTIVATVLLIPTYVLVGNDVSAKETQLARIQTTLSSSEEATLATRLAVLTNYAQTLNELGTAPSITGLMRDLLGISRPGITLSTFVYAPPTKIQYKNSTDTKPATLTVSGTAATRDALRNYQLSLQNAPFVSAANLPVSAYAQDANISFTIVITLAP